MREIARRLGYDHPQIYTYFPELCRQISARYLLYQKTRGLERHTRLCQEVRTATYELHAQGVYPSSYRIASLISQPGFVRHPDAMSTRHDVLRELGWKD
jgi:hypothetical protein